MNKRIEILGTKMNKCCIFILPMCGITRRSLPDNFINCYLNWDRGQDNYQIVIVFDKNTDYTVSLENFKRYAFDNRCYAGIEELEDETILYFNIPDRYKGNYELFLAGRYSQFSPDYKKILVSNYGSVSNTHNYEVREYDVIYPTDNKRLQIAKRLYADEDVNDGLKLIKEVFDIPNMDVERYRSVEQLIILNSIEKQITNQSYDNQ